MGLSHEHVGPKILAKIQIYIITSAELLFTLCSEIPCIYHSIKLPFDAEVAKKFLNVIL